MWFLSLDASSPLFARLGRELYGLRYRVARMAVAAEGASGAVHYLSSRAGAAFAASYRSCGPPARARRGSLEYFLVERYRLFSHGTDASSLRLSPTSRGCCNRRKCVSS